MVYNSLVNLEKGIFGIVLISEDLEIIYDMLLLNRVPKAWSFCYYSLKSLNSWMIDLEKRMLEANLLSTMHIKDPPKKPSKPIKKKAN